MWGSGNCGELGVYEPNRLSSPLKIMANETHNYKSCFCKNNFTAMITSMF